MPLLVDQRSLTVGLCIILVIGFEWFKVGHCGHHPVENSRRRVDSRQAVDQLKWRQTYAFKHAIAWERQDLYDDDDRWRKAEKYAPEANGTIDGNSTSSVIGTPSLAGRAIMRRIKGFTNDKFCGVSRVLPTTGRIINGWEVKEGEMPWVVNLKWNNETQCGGSMITRQWVLTAAHCLLAEGKPRHDWDRLTVGYGSTKEAESKQIGVSTIVIHYKYKGTTNDKRHDIALLKLRKSPAIKSHRKTGAMNINLFCLPALGSLVNGTGFVAGWGRVRDAEDEPASPRLMATKLNVKNKAQCFNNYTTEYEYMILSKRGQFCASAPGTDACQGDRSVIHDCDLRLIDILNHSYRDSVSFLAAAHSGSMTWIRMGMPAPRSMGS